MKTMTLEEWGDYIKNDAVVLSINYDAGITVVFDKLDSHQYNATYNITTGMMELR